MSEIPARRSEFSSVCLAVAASALSGDAGGVYRLVSGLMDAGVSFETVLFDVLLPVENDVGLRWQAGDQLISEEHAATAAIETVIALLAGSFDQPADAPHVVVAAAEGDPHSLPGRTVAAHLLFLGYRTSFLGANVLATDLGEYLSSGASQTLVLSCAMVNHLVGARSAIRASHAAGVPVVAGGRAFGSSVDRAVKLGADAWAADARSVAGILERWEPDPAASESRARDPSPELRDLISRRTTVLAAAEESLGRRLDRVVGARARTDLDVLLGAVEAGLLLDDETVVAEALAWQEELLSAHGFRHVRLLPEVVAEGLERVSGEVAARLRQTAAAHWG